MTKHPELKQWVEETARLTTPDRIYWCDGSAEEYQDMTKQLLATGGLLQLNETTHPHCYLHRSHPSDVARTEHLTFICTKHQEDAGPNNHWMSPEEGHKKIDALFAGAMKGRTMYVIPYCMGPLGSAAARCGVEITDSLYVVLNMHMMTRAGTKALELIERTGSFVKGLHSLGDLSPERRFIMHFPHELSIKSIGSGYGGNALLGKKCHALRIASYQAQQEGWLAEHMLILGVQNPKGQVHYMTAAFPSACGKTNLAMLIPPERYKGWKIWTIGDDIAWLRLGEDGRLYAMNPEAGFFGVVPGTSQATNPHALQMLNHHTIFTNVGVNAHNQPWWEGLNQDTPVLNWQGKPFVPGDGPATHPNARFTVSMKQCASYSPEAENPQGVPISAIIFGGRRPHLIPLVYEAKNWQHGVLMGASVASETTAAATGQVGVLRHDPMAMKPFCGYNFGDYWKHWLSFGERSNRLPKIFHVNWFRQNEKGQYMWPGFGDNMRVLEWILDRCHGDGRAAKTPIGYVPAPGAICTEGLEAMTPQMMQDLTDVKPKGWGEEIRHIETYLQSFGNRLPQALTKELAEIKQELRL